MLSRFSHIFATLRNTVDYAKCKHCADQMHCIPTIAPFLIPAGLLSFALIVEYTVGENPAMCHF